MSGKIAHDVCNRKNPVASIPEHSAPAEPLPVVTVPGSTSCPDSPANEFEKTLDKPMITNLQEALGIPAAKRSGVMDAATRSAIKAFSAANTELPGQKCLLSAEKTKAILGGK